MPSNKEMLAWESDGDEDLAVLHQMKTYIQTCGIAISLLSIYWELLILMLGIEVCKLHSAQILCLIISVSHHES